MIPNVELCTQLYNYDMINPLISCPKMQTQPDQLDLVDEVPPHVEPRLETTMKDEPGHAPAEEPKSKRNIVIIGMVSSSPPKHERLY